MTTLRQLCAATLLSLTLAISAFAGHIDCPGVVAPSSTCVAGHIDCPGVASTDTGTTSATTDVILTVVSLTY